MPFNSDTMIFKPDSGQYMLTEKALIQSGFFLRERLSRTRCPSPEYVIQSILEDVSDMIYDYIHRHSVHNDFQDHAIAKLPSARAIIEKAMRKQAEYILFDGNLFLNPDENIRSKAISEETIRVLSKTIPEIGTSILYSGV